MKVDIETIRKIQKKRTEINSVPLNDVEFYEKGEKVEISKEALDKFIYTGLSNFDFITSGFYKEYD